MRSADLNPLTLAAHSNTFFSSSSDRSARTYSLSHGQSPEPAWPPRGLLAEVHSSRLYTNVINLARMSGSQPSVRRRERANFIRISLRASQHIPPYLALYAPGKETIIIIKTQIKGRYQTKLHDRFVLQHSPYVGAINWYSRTRSRLSRSRLIRSQNPQKPHGGLRLCKFYARIYVNIIHFYR